MGTTAAVHKETLEDVILYVKQLEQRIAALERRAEQPVVVETASAAIAGTVPAILTGSLPEDVPAAAVEAAGGSEGSVVAASAPAVQPGVTLNRGTFATVAKALLGFGGAYVLRAIAESGTVPLAIGVLAGVFYALLGLWMSTRVNREDRVGPALYGLTSALIFAGIVWENSVRLHGLPDNVAAPLIVAFCGVALYLSWRRDLTVLASLTTMVSASLALVLLLVTHDLVPFTAALLSIAAMVEFGACRGCWTAVRWFPALSADLAIFVVAWVITQPQGLPESYRPFGMSSVVTLQIMLVLIYVAAMGYRTLVTGIDIAGFEIAQNTAAIGLFIWGSVLMGREAPVARFAVEAFCLLAGMACYATAILLLAKQNRERNFLMYGLFGLALLVAGVSILFSGLPLVVVWCALGVGASWLGTHEHRLSLQLHTPVFLAAAALASGLPAFAVQALHSSTAPSGSRLIEILLATVALVSCYWMSGAEDTGKARIPALLVGALLCWALLGLGGAGITTLLGPDSTLSSALRTGLICGLALALARPGSRRPELVWLMYPLMLYGAYRLLTEDFPSGRPTAVALALLFYGGTLLQLTRMRAAR